MEIYQKNLRCRFCQKVFNKRNILKRHLREKHYCGNVYKCNMCSISFARKERLMRHLKSVHFNLKFECSECQMKFVEKFKHNSHMVHSHNYNYCQECKISFPPQKFGNRHDHICESTVKYYKCYTDKCKGKKKHLQFEHQIQEFDRLKSVIDDSTYEMKKKRKKSRIKAKTLENNKDDLEDAELKELLDYANDYCGNELEKQSINPQDIIDQMNIEKQDSFNSDSEQELQEYYIQTKEDNMINNNLKNKNNHPQQQIQTKEEKQLQELMRNINIICMMENNQKTYYNNNNSSILDDDYSLTNKDTDQIILGKRGRPSKKLDKSVNTVDKVMDSYLSKIQGNMKQKSVIIKRNYTDFNDKEISTVKNKDKKKMKPVYYDDILMETLNITRRVNKKESIFSIHRKKSVLYLNNEMTYIEEDMPFIDEKLTFLRISSDTRYKKKNLKEDERIQFINAQLSLM